ncbi:MAG: flagellar hook-associated protein FlgK [Bacteriovoracaceae bacterium]|nr:flagellar hook-associated protein FlgK [Bacteriovoracaceae bacterium]
MADLLNIGKTGLMASKKSLGTTGHNIANANTEGYSRQRVMQTSATPVAKGGVVEGTGTRIRSIERVHDDNIEKRLHKTQSEQRFYEQRSEQLRQVEDIFNELDNDGLNKILNKFYNSFRELANQPENETIRSIVRDTAGLVTKDFKRISGTLDSLSRNIDRGIEKEVTDINQLLKNTANLNTRIAYIEAMGDETGDLRDQRDGVLRELSKSFQIKTYRDNKNNFIVSAVGVGTLVTGADIQELSASGTNKENSSNNMGGSVEIYFKNRPQLPITAKFRSGQLSSILQVRNSDITELRERIDSIAYDFTNTVNAIHRRGFASRKVPVDEAGNPALKDQFGPVTGINFFKKLEGISGASSQISLSQAVKDDLSNIVTAVNSNSPGDNRIAVAVSKLQHERVMSGGTATLEEYYLQTVGRVGLETNKANLDSEQFSGILTQLQSLKERVSGVSIDEETANMVRYQHAYEASAKVMQTADEMFKTVLSLKR